MKTVYTRITSGLGNQLFQYAAGRSYAQRWEADLAVETSWFEFFQRHLPRRSYLLSRLKLHASNPCKPPQVFRFFLGIACINQPIIQKVFQKFFSLFGYFFINEKTRFVEDDQLRQPPPEHGSLLLNGYWQCASYVAPVLDVMRKEICQSWRFSAPAEIWKKEMESGASAFIHIRQGDYQQFGTPILDTSYYKRAVEFLCQTTGKIRWFVFVEDTTCVADILSFLSDYQVVTVDSENREIEELLLMACCPVGGIIANSSFSWWGAALGAAGRTIAAPSIWIYPGVPHPEGLYPHNWHVIQAGATRPELS